MSSFIFRAAGFSEIINLLKETNKSLKNVERLLRENVQPEISLLGERGLLIILLWLLTLVHPPDPGFSNRLINAIHLDVKLCGWIAK